MRALLIVFLSALLVQSASAEERKQMASNGQAITISGDRFKPNTDYASDLYHWGFEAWNFIVRKYNDGKTMLLVQGYIQYPGDWHDYDRAFLPGGEMVQFTSFDRKVLDCPYRRPCWYQEEFQLTFTPQQVARAIKQGSLQVQVGSVGGNEFIVDVPIQHVNAALEVSGIQLGSDDVARSYTPAAASP
jgi:hypothetical protein